MKKILKQNGRLLSVFLVASLMLNILALAIVLKPQINKLTQTRKDADKKKETADIFNEINPESGYEINVSYGKLGPSMIEQGVIDIDKFKANYEKSGSPLSQEQLEILTKGSDKKIKITRDNSYFLLNYFWAAGLLNKSKVLTEGDMTAYGGLEGAGNFASTGGWSLSKENPMDYYAAASLIPMTESQETLATEVAGKIFRPCCDNSTAFPDCNHGMALLSVIQLMAANGATEKEMFEAGKYFNAFWFPGNYYDLALYFKNKEGKNFKDLDGELVLSREYSSATGWSKAKKWLSNKGIIQESPKSGGGCGV
jgi:hypothetical protein